MGLKVLPLALLCSPLLYVVNGFLRGCRHSISLLAVLLADISPRRRNYQKALHGLETLRNAAVQHGRGASFNDTLKDLQTRFQSATQHHSFWQLIMDQQMTLISDEEVPGTGISAAEAEAFLKQHASKAKASVVLLPPFEQWPDAVFGLPSMPDDRTCQRC